MKGLTDLMKQAQQMQERMQALQAELTQLEVTGEAGAGMGKGTLHGRHEARRGHIDPSIAKEDLAVLEDLIAAAINDAVHRAERAQQEKMATLTAGLGLPADFKMPF